MILMMLPVCGAVNLDTALLFVPARSTPAPGVVTPKVNVPSDPVTVIVTGELVADAPWLSVTLSLTLYAPGTGT